MNLNNVEFIKSAVSPTEFLYDGLPKIVFSGRSNVGKSSVINKLLGRKKLARVSSVPGKTIHVNYFLIDKAAYFIDLPGYGYANVSKAERDRWSKLMEAFFSGSADITLGVMIVDARHKPSGDDVTMAKWFKSSLCPLTVVANKIDKAKSSEREQSLSLIRDTLGLDAGVIPFSAEKGTNRDLLLQEIEKAINVSKCLSEP